MTNPKQQAAERHKANASKAKKVKLARAREGRKQRPGNLNVVGVLK